MKKKLLTAVLAGMLAMSTFVGCSSGNGANDGVTTPDPTTDVAVTLPDMTQPVEIEMWHYMAGKQQEILDEIVADFNSTNGMGITVSAIPQGKVTDLNKKVIAASQSSTLPAIINVYPDIATGLIEQGKIFNMNAYVTHAEAGIPDIATDFVEAFIAEVAQWDGNLYGMPLSKSTEVVYVNKTLLEELGYTMEDIQDLTMEKLAEISKASRETLSIPGFGYDSSSNAFISTLKMEDMDFVELNGTINVDNEWVRTFMEFYREQITQGYFRTPGEDGFLSTPFSNQQMLMYQGSSAGASFINTNGAFELAIVEPPYFEGKNQAVIQQGGSLFITNDVSEQAQYAAYEFMKFATNPENTAKFAVNTGYLPVRKSAADTELIQTALADTEGVFGKVYPSAIKALEYAYYTPAVNNAQSARNTIKEKFEGYVGGNIDNVETFVNESLNEVGTSIERQ